MNYCMLNVLSEVAVVFVVPLQYWLLLYKYLLLHYFLDHHLMMGAYLEPCVRDPDDATTGSQYIFSTEPVRQYCSSWIWYTSYCRLGVSKIENWKFKVGLSRTHWSTPKQHWRNDTATSKKCFIRVRVTNRITLLFIVHELSSYRREKNQNRYSTHVQVHMLCVVWYQYSRCVYVWKQAIYFVQWNEALLLYKL